MVITLRGQRIRGGSFVKSIFTLFTLSVLQGFAFINFVHREDAARAIQSVQGFGYDHLILSVEWAK